MTTIVEILLQSGANIESEDLVYDCFPLTPLGVAAMEGHAGVAQVLLKYNASVNVMSEEGSPLFIASGKGHTDVVRLLLENNADIELGEDKCNETPLFAATGRAHLQIIELLLLHGANPNFRSVVRTNSTSVAIVKNRIRHVLNTSAELMDSYLRQFNFTDKSYEGNIFVQITSLHQAIANNDTAAVRTLLKYGASPNIRKTILKYHETPLSVACMIGNLDIVLSLLKAGAKVNARGMFGNTALHEAALIRRRDIIEVLIRYGGDLSAKNDDGFTPMYVLKRHELAYHFQPNNIL